MAAATPFRQAASDAALWTLGAISLAVVGVVAGLALSMGEVDALLVLLAVIAGVAVLFDFRIGAVLLILMLPVEPTTLFPHSMMGITGLNPLNLVLMATLASFVLRGRLQRVGPLVPRQMLWLYMVPIVIGGLIGAPHAADALPLFYEYELLHFTNAPGYLRDMVIKPLFLPLAALLIGAAVARSDKPERFFAPIVVSMWVMCAIQFTFIALSGVSLGYLASPTAREFFSELGVHANSLGRFYAAGYALLLFAWADTRDPRLKVSLFATMAVVSLGLVLTFSRGGFMGFFVINALFLLWKFNARYLALALFAGAFATMMAPGYLYRRITMGFEEDANTVSAGRIEGIWQPLLPELANSPIWGNGLGSITWSDPMLSDLMLTVTHPHNAYLEAFLDMGIVGLVLLLAYFVHVWKGFRVLGSNAYLTPTMRGFYQGAAACLVGFLVTGTVGGSLRPEPEFVYLWLAIGMMYGHLARRPAG